MEHKKILVYLMISFALVIVGSQHCNFNYFVFHNKEVPTNIQPIYKEKVWDRTDCAKKIQKYPNVKCASYSREDGCLLFNLPLLQHQLLDRHGTDHLYIEKNCESCFCWRQSGHINSGLYVITADGQQQHKVYCDMVMDGGGWTVFQRRMNGEINFTRNWEDYARGFGDVEKEHWLGNRLIHALSSSKQNELRVDLASFYGNKQAYAKYAKFSVGFEAENFVLDVDNYTGTAGDNLEYHSGMDFTTFDVDNDIDTGRNCAVDYKGGWWYRSCHITNLNGLYTNSVTTESMCWKDWEGRLGQRESTMMMRPIVQA